jgi:hypothetical protein
LSTIGDGPSDVFVGTFGPEQNQYRQDSLSLNSVPGLGNNITIRFSMTSDKGNFLYLDDVVIGGLFTQSANQIRSHAGLVIIPNPGYGNSRIYIPAEEGDTVEADLIDLHGRVLAHHKIQNAGSREIPMNEIFGIQKSGMYLVRVKSKRETKTIRWLNK